MSFNFFSELECYDICVSLGEFVPDKSDETQTVSYEDFRLASRQPFVGPVFDDDGEEILQSRPTTEVANVSDPDDEKDMDRIERFSGGGGAPIVGIRAAHISPCVTIPCARELRDSENGNL